MLVPCLQVGACGTLQPGISRRGWDQHRPLIASALALAVMGALTHAIGWLVAGRLLRPLRTISPTTKEISAHQPAPNIQS